jgi:plastocyanin domain-containing protein
MNATNIIVITAGLAAIGWVNWYFFLAGRSTVAAIAQDVTVVVRGGYSPAVIRAAAGKPLRITFDRQETSGCSEEIVFPDFGLKRFLPANTATPIEITPPKAGTYEFTCGMGMLHGRVIAE